MSYARVTCAKEILFNTGGQRHIQVPLITMRWYTNTKLRLNSLFNFYKSNFTEIAILIYGL